MAVTEIAITGAVSLIGTIVGGGITYLTQKSISKRQLEKEHQEEVAKIKREKLEFYGIVLKENGILGIIDDPSNFKVNLYKESIRNTFYEKIYLLTPSMINQLSDIDLIIKTIEGQHVNYSGDFIPASLKYEKIIELIILEIQNLQVN